MRISHIKDKDDILFLEMYLSRLAICMDNIEEHEKSLSHFKDTKRLTEKAIKDLVEKWQR